MGGLPLESIHVRPPGALVARRDLLVEAVPRKHLVQDVLARDPVNPCYLNLAEGSSERHGIAPVGPLGNIDDKHLLELGFGQRRRYEGNSSENWGLTPRVPLRISGDFLPEAVRYCRGDRVSRFAGLSKKKSPTRRPRARAAKR